MIRIILDCFGGDHSPEANVAGALLSLSAHPDLSLVLTGDEEKIRQALEGKTYDASRLEIVHAPEVISCSDKPTDAIRLKKESSMMKGISLLRNDEAGEYAGMVSAGSTGALVAAAMLRIGRLPGVIRPAFCPILPTMTGGIVGICDSGANVDITPAHIRQYAVMASLYLQKVYGIERPRVGLLNIGTEPEKGDDLHKEAFRLLSDTPGICFCGNMESRELLGGKYDLCVCDGFSGNILIKSVEGTSLGLLKKLKTDIYANPWNKLGGLILSGMFKKEKEFMDYRNYGGSVMLGTEKTVIKAHGSSNANTVAKSVDQVYLTAASGLNAAIAKAIAAAEGPKEAAAPGE